MKFSKILLIGALFFTAIGFGAPQQPPNGGTGVSNCPTCTITVGAPLNLTASASSALSINDVVKGSRPFPVKTETERDAIPSPETGLIVYNSTTKTLDYYDGAAWQKILITPAILAGANVTITDNGNGTVTVSASGGGDAPAPAFAAYSVRGNLATRPGIAGSFVAVPVSSGFNDDQDACFTTSLESIGGITTPVSRFICPETQFFAVDQSMSLQGVATTFRQYIYAIAVVRAGGSVETTNYRLPATQYGGTTEPSNDHPTSVHGIVQLAQGDGVFTQIYGASLDQTAPTTYITSKIESMAGSAQPTFQNIYDSDSSYPVSTIALANSGEFQIIHSTGGGDETPFSANASTGIFSSLGLRLFPSTNTEDIRFLNTLDPASTLAEMISTTRGAKSYPAMTAAQGGAIGGTKPQGLGFFDTDTNTLDFWTGSLWTNLINSTSNQTIGGTKTFSNTIQGNISGSAATATTATNANTVFMSSTTTNSNYFLNFAASNSSGYQASNVTSGVTVNPSTKTITATNYVGTTLNATSGINGTALAVAAGGSTGSGVGANLNLTAGGATTNGNGGDVIITGGTTGTGGIAGNVRIRAGLAPSGTPGNVVFDQGNVTVNNTLSIPSATALSMGSAVSNLLTVNASTGANNRADLVLNRFDTTNGFNRVLFFNGGTGIWSAGMRSGSNNFVMFDDANLVSQLTMTPGSGTTGTSAFAGSVSANQLSVGPSQTQAISTAINIRGTNSTFNSAVNWFTSADQYPIFQLMPFAHNNTTYSMDAYYDGSGWKSSYANSSYQIAKFQDNLDFNYGVAAAGSTLTWNTALRVNSSGNIFLPNAGKTFSVKSGTNGCIGTQVLSGASTVVNTSCATTGDLIFFTITSPGGTPGQYSYTISNGVSFTITSTQGAGDTSTVGWWDVKKP